MGDYRKMPFCHVVEVFKCSIFCEDAVVVLTVYMYATLKKANEFGPDIIVSHEYKNICSGF